MIVEELLARDRNICWSLLNSRSEGNRLEKMDFRRNLIKIKIKIKICPREIEASPSLDKIQISNCYRGARRNSEFSKMKCSTGYKRS